MKQKTCFLTTVFLVVFMASSSAQSLDTIRRNDPGGWEFLQVRRGNNVITEGSNHKGKPEGTWVTYWESSGYPMTIINYHDGKRDGLSLQINAQGYTEMVESYKNDVLDGPKRVYQIGSQFLNEETYYSDGKKHGSYHKRYTSGKPQEDATFNMGERDGKTTWYYESGEKAAEYNYRNGNIDGEVASYYKNGKVSEYGRYANDEQTGLWKEFYENGNIKAEGNYSKGKKEGSWKEYDENGKLVKTVKYKNGEVK